MASLNLFVFDPQAGCDTSNGIWASCWFRYQIIDLDSEESIKEVTLTVESSAGKTSESRSLTKSESYSNSITIQYGPKAQVGCQDIITITIDAIIEIQSENLQQTYDLSESEQITVFTPNRASGDDFWKNWDELLEDDQKLKSNCLIHKHITRDNVKQWLQQLRIWKSWKEQYNYYNSYSDEDYVPASEEPITAVWYNSLAKASNGTYQEVVGGPNGTIIEAEHFIDLARKVTTWN